MLENITLEGALALLFVAGILKGLADKYNREQQAKLIAHELDTMDRSK